MMPKSGLCLVSCTVAHESFRTLVGSFRIAISYALLLQRDSIVTIVGGKIWKKLENVGSYEIFRSSIYFNKGRKNTPTVDCTLHR